MTLLLRSDSGIELPSANLAPQGGGRYGGVAAIPFPSNWTLRYSFFVPGEGFHAHTTHLVVEGSHHHHAAAPETVSQGPLRAPLAWAAAATGHRRTHRRRGGPCRARPVPHQK